MRSSSSWIRARVAASGILDRGVLAVSAGRAGADGVTDLGGVPLDCVFTGVDGVVFATSTLCLHPTTVTQSAVTASPVRNRDFIEYTSIFQHTENRGSLASRRKGILPRAPARLYYHALMRTALVCLVCAAVALAGDKEDLLKRMDTRAAHYGDVSRQIWEFSEVGYKEYKSADLLKSELRQAGFTVEENVAGIPTAFTATWGQGKPVIAVLG